MMTKLHAACIQTNHGADVDANIAALSDHVRAAHAKGATLILTPECSDNMTWPVQEKVKAAFTQDKHPTLKAMQDLAAQLSIWLVIGSLAIKDPSHDKLLNRSYVISPEGKIVNHYDKIHLFDATLSEQESYRESAYYQAGERACVHDIGKEAKLGLSVCYDIRFAALYRNLARNGANIMLVPAAFSVPTGKAHWEVLLRARAIETGSYVLAAGQTGSHPGGRMTYGHSMIINPWGEVMAGLGGDDQVGFVDAQLDMDSVVSTRQALPCLSHDRDFSI